MTIKCPVCREPMRATDNGLEQLWICINCPGVSQTVNPADMVQHRRAMGKGGRQ